MFDVSLAAAEHVRTLPLPMIADFTRRIARLVTLGCVVAQGAASAATPSPVQMLTGGFTVRELPVQLTSINNVEYAADGRLFAAGYDGRVHVLRDQDGDGVEEAVATFWEKTSPNYPLGIAVRDGVPYLVLSNEVVRFVDANGDGVPDTREVFAKDFDLPELARAPYLLHRRVDNAMGVAFGPDGALYVTMGNAGYNNAYWTDKQGVSHYSPDKRRGCLLRITADGKVEQLASGLRYIMSLQWNRAGDLFGTDQEGATWSPNGNPFDELLHLEAGRFYGFPPRHPKFLPNVIEEPSVWDYGPQHQSTCGFRFNGPLPGRGRFGPEFWADNAIVTGESRGKLWRTVLAKTAAGYVARTDLIASMPLLAVDCAISPQGDLVVACHTGAPDWGNGPTGQGRLFKISFAERTAPQPVATWAASETETVLAFDRQLEPKHWSGALAATTRIDSGRYVGAADRLETMRPGYAVVKQQQREPRGVVAVKQARLSADGRELRLETVPRASAVNYAIAIEGKLDVAHDLSGIEAAWRSAERGAEWRGWLPHADFVAAREFTRGSARHEALWTSTGERGTLVLKTQLDLWKMLIPVTQPGSQLDFTPEPEVVTVVFTSDAPLELETSGTELRVERVSARESRLTVSGPREDAWVPITVTLATPARRLDVSYHTDRDSRPRALQTRRFVMPFAKPGVHDLAPRMVPEIAGGDWHAGRALFNGKAACASCHELRGEGARVGPELANLIHRDYASVLQDIAEPNATINPDGVGYVVTMKDGTSVAGTQVGESAIELRIAQVGGAVARLKKSEIAKAEPMTTSLMPAGLDKALTAAELRDLMTYLLTSVPAEPATTRSQ